MSTTLSDLQKRVGEIEQYLAIKAARKRWAGRQRRPEACRSSGTDESLEHIRELTRKLKARLEEAKTNGPKEP